MSVDINGIWIRIRVTGSRFGKIHYFGAKVVPCCGGQMQLFLAPKWHPAVEGGTEFEETHFNFGTKTVPYCRGRIRVYWILKCSKML
jgi:hypothetical protein